MNITRLARWGFALSAAALVGVPSAWTLSRPPRDVGSIPASSPSGEGRPSRHPERVSARGGVGLPLPERIRVHWARLSDQRTGPRGPIPERILIPSIEVDAPVVSVGIEERDGGVEVPPDVHTVGWYRFGSRPGRAGSAVFIGHVDSKSQGAGAFFRLSSLDPGASIDVRYGNGERGSFKVVGRRFYPKSALPERIFSTSGPPRLTLVTCGGSFNWATGHYSDNVVVYAVPRSGDR